MKTCATEKEWLELRRGSLTASEVAVAMGVSKYKTPIDLWAEKTGRVEPFSGNLATSVGSALEPVVASEYQKKSGRIVESIPPFSVWFDQQGGVLAATPDRFQYIVQAKQLLELKTTSWRNEEEWKSGNVPFGYLLQLQVQMMCTGLTRGTLACLVGGETLYWHDYEADVDLQDTIRHRVNEWWEKFVLDDTQPPVGLRPDEVWLNSIKRLHPDDTGEVKHIDAKLIIAYQNAKMALSQAEKAKIEAETELRAALGDGTFCEYFDGDGTPIRYACKTQTRKGKLCVLPEYAKHLEGIGIPFTVEQDSKFRALREVKKFA